jgi:magnesium-transporting ATPase (P-type)
MVGNGVLVSKSSIDSMLYNIQIAVVLLIVSIPEGMPLAISMALAFSIDRLK